MTLRHGREFLSIPGPSMYPDRVLQAMHRPAPNIYEGELIELTATIHEDLRRLAGTEGDSVIYVANGHGAWEAALANTVGPGDRVLALNAGLFIRGWAEMARRRGVEVELIDTDERGPVSPQLLAERLAADPEHRISAVLVAQIDTASSVSNDVEALGAVLAGSGHPALLMVDAIASFGCVPLEMDAWGVDVVVTAGQKGLMTPPGVSFNLIGPRAWTARERREQVSEYWDWELRCHSEAYYRQFGGTPPTHHLFGLRAALDMIAEEGIDTVHRRHRVLAGAVRACVSEWAAGGPLEFNVIDPAHRSDAVTTVLTGEADADALRRQAEDHYGLVLGLGIGATGRFRIGHMGHLNPPMILGTLATTEAAMVALGIAHRSGVAAAIEVIAAG